MANTIYVPKSDILDLITETNEAGGFTDYSDYSNLWDEIDYIPAARRTACEARTVDSEQ